MIQGSDLGCLFPCNLRGGAAEVIVPGAQLAEPGLVEPGRTGSASGRGPVDAGTLMSSRAPLQALEATSLGGICAPQAAQGPGAR